MSTASGSSASTISIRDTVALLDGRFRAFADAVTKGQYTFWLGSGISKGRVDDLEKLVRRILDHLQQRVDHSSSTCRFKKALEEAMVLADLSARDRAIVDFRKPVEEWNSIESIVSHLAKTYAKFLDIIVDGEASDYLLWVAADVCNTYARNDLEPDSEHLCLAILAIEGAVSDLACANWDGLVEKATQELMGSRRTVLQVVIRNEDARDLRLRTRLFKFHGCAVEAKRDETTYRPLLVAAQSQINAWSSDGNHAVMFHKLVDYVVTQPTLVVGLSAQDANIQNIFAAAQSRMAWHWPSIPPAYVFAEDSLGVDQGTLLRVVYGSSVYATNRQAIEDGALVRSYGKQLLLALVLYLLSAKFCALVDLANAPQLTIVGRDELKTGILKLRDRLAYNARPDYVAFVRQLVAQSSKSLSLFSEGKQPSDSLYRPLGILPVHQIVSDPNLSTSGLREFAVALGIFGMGEHRGLWRLTLATLGSGQAGALSILSGSSVTRLFFVANSDVALTLQMNGYFSEADADAALICSTNVVAHARRSPLAPPGRTGKTGLRSVGVSGLLGTAVDADELMQRFREELAI